MNDTAEWQVECAYQLDRGYFTETPQVTPDGKYLVESTVKALLFYDFHTGQLVKRIHTTPAADYSPCFSISHDGKTVFSFNTEEWRYYSLGANIINVESWENKVLNFRKCNDVDCDYLSDYSHGYAVFSNDDKWLFYLRDTISRTSFNRYDVLKAFSLIDSTEYSFQNGDDIMFLLVHHFRMRWRSRLM